MFGLNASAASPAPPLPGWYGKLPATGDFASRRLPPEFIAAWDEFLGAAVAGSKQLLGEDWLDHYLASPIWQFVVFPPLCGAGAWAGLMMPSVDRVGRYFPLTVCSRLGAIPASPESADGLLDWLGTLESAALGALDPDARIEDFETALRTQAEHCPLPTAAVAAPLPARGEPLQPGLLLLQEGPEMSAWLAQVFADPARLLGHSIWWSFAVAGERIPAAIVRGLPSPQSYARMIGGNF